MDVQSLENALQAENPFAELRNYLQRLVHAGYDREKLVRDLLDFSYQLRAENRDDDDDLILEMVDFLTGWCSPHMRI